MKTSKLILLIVVIFTITNCKKNTNKITENIPLEQAREFYQLKTYMFDTDEQVQTTDNYLKDAFLPALKKQGIKNIGVFKSRLNETDSLKKIVVLIPFSSLARFHALDGELAKDNSYLTAGSDYINASYEQPPYQRLESVLLKAFKDMPFMQASKLDGPRSDRIYELRSYESPTESYFKNKLDMFNAGGEIKLFDRLEFNAVFYGEVISGSKMPNLMYMTTFSNQESRDAHWKTFFESPEWQELKADARYKNNVSHIDINFLYPTNYSDY